MSATNNTISFLTSNKGCDLLVKDDFIFKISKRMPSKIYWICKTKDCNAYVHTDADKTFLKSSGEHNHLLEPEDLQVHKFREVLKERVVNETTPIPKIFDEELAKAQFSPEVLANVPLVNRIGKV